jgi:hypothetical protein
MVDQIRIRRTHFFFRTVREKVRPLVAGNSGRCLYRNDDHFQATKNDARITVGKYLANSTSMVAPAHQCFYGRNEW